MSGAVIVQNHGRPSGAADWGRYVRSPGPGAL